MGRPSGSGEGRCSPAGRQTRRQATGSTGDDGVARCDGDGDVRRRGRGHGCPNLDPDGVGRGGARRGASGVRARVRSGVDRGDKGSEGAGWAIGPAGWAAWPSWPGGFSFSLFVLFVFFSYFSFSVLIHLIISRHFTKMCAPHHN